MDTPFSIGFAYGSPRAVRAEAMIYFLAVHEGDELERFVQEVGFVDADAASEELETALIRGELAVAVTTPIAGAAFQTAVVVLIDSRDVVEALTAGITLAYDGESRSLGIAFCGDNLDREWSAAAARWVGAAACGFVKRRRGITEPFALVVVVPTVLEGLAFFESFAGILGINVKEQVLNS